MPGDPVHEEKNVPAFFLDHGLKRVDEGFREKSRALCGLEQSKGEKAIDALAVAGDHEGPFWILRPWIGWLGRQLDAVSLDEIRQHIAMAAFFKAGELNGLAQKRIDDLLTVGRDIETGPIFRLNGDVPDRQGNEPVARLIRKLRPVNHGRPVGIECVEQRFAEEPLVFCAAVADRAAGGWPGTGVDRKVRKGKRRTAQLQAPPQERGLYRRGGKSAKPPSLTPSRRAAAMVAGSRRAASSSR